MFDDEEDTGFDLTSHVSLRKKMAPAGVHIPNKAERKVLTQLMQKSGQTEAEVRESKTNRQKLAKARKSMSERKGNKYRLKLRAERVFFATQLGLNINDPRVTAIAADYLSRVWMRAWPRHMFADFRDEHLARVRERLNKPA